MRSRAPDPAEKPVLVTGYATMRGEIEQRVKTLIQQRGGSVDRAEIVTKLRREYPAEMVDEAVFWLKYETRQIAERNGQFEIYQV